jgi:putative tricarboxylic transport membrane protein
VRARLSDRIAGAIFLAVATAYWVVAGDYAVSYGDPAGPTLFPRMIAVPFGVFALFLIVRPDPDPVWLRWPQVLGQVGTLLVLVAYPLALEPIGFPLATFVGTALLARILGGTWLQAALSGLATGIGLFVLFDTIFGLPLPLGPGFQ